MAPDLVMALARADRGAALDRVDQDLARVARHHRIVPKVNRSCSASC